MLQYLHVKNLALIDEIEVEFKNGLNILTGETGAGKSIILGSVNLALGGRYHADLLREGAKFGLVELIFTVDNPVICKQLEAYDIYPEEGLLTLSRKLMDGRSISKINGETVNMSTLKDVASILIDIHGQHDHQTLLHKKNHLTLLDDYAKEKIGPLIDQVKEAYRIYKNALRKVKEAGMDEQSRQREISLAEYEIHEIEEAALLESEDEELDALYQRMNEGKQVTDSITETYRYTADSGSDSASDLLSRAIRAFQEASKCDEAGAALYEQLVEIDSLLNDFNRELSEYEKSFEFSEEEFYETENRLNVVNHLKAKYGNTVKQINEYCASRQQRLQELQDYENYVQRLEDALKKSEEDLKKKSEALSKARKKSAVPFVKEITAALKDLNFLDVKFDLKIEKLDSFTSNGVDDGEFYISTNPGEPLKPLGNVASGGELSRIMLAIKSVLADKENTPTLIFDEIDTGISGITAGKVAEKMHGIATNRQVICITHLPQIAAMADSHFLIRKHAEDSKTKTDIRCLNDQDSVMELARILGGANITDKILESAVEMKEMAKREK